MKEREEGGNRGRGVGRYGERRGRKRWKEERRGEDGGNGERRGIKERRRED